MAHIDLALQPQATFPEMEEKVLDYWDAIEAFKQSVESRPKTDPYVFYDGPPFATGLPHYGHILASTMKDVVPRYWTMMGKRVERVWGWDCHGLPIENIIEKELNLADKQALEAYGIGKFNMACEATVMRYADEWKKIIKRIGRWVDMENDYKTMDRDYMESLWWVFKQLWQRGLIYQGHKAMHICPRCSTPLSNFEVTQAYKEVKDLAVYVEFELLDPKKLGSEARVFMLAWTTTPWTLPGNALLALNSDTEYVLFESNQKGNQYIVAANRLEAVVGDEPCVEIKRFTGKQLVGLAYKPLFSYFSDTPNAFKTVPASFVTTDEGTGIVHIAPGFGEDDYNLGKENKIPLITHVTMEGTFVEEVSDFAGLKVKPKDNPLETDLKILRFLQEHDLLFKKETIKHSYPHCWRCDTPLINYATVSWFVNVTQFKTELLSNNQKINWIPEHIKDGRFGNWLEGARDWAISRNRYWGTPIPIWQSQDGEVLCIGSHEELEQLSGQKVGDLHKHVIDEIEIQKDGKRFKRVPEVLDCWFESGAMPYASFHYPFENKERFEASFPAEFISEGQDQTRGWFYTLHVLATALTYGDTPAIRVEQTTSSFKNCVVTGIVLAEDGKKMSKHLQNYPDPMIVTDKYGVDSLRMYLMSSPVVRADNLNFNEKEVDEIRKKVLSIMRNVLSFYLLYADKESQTPLPHKLDHVLDQWILARLSKVEHHYHEAMQKYDVVTAVRIFMDFVPEISNWWLRLSRERLKDSSQNEQPLEVLRTCLLRWAMMAAPFAPFFSEVIYQQLNHKKDSIHLELFADQQNLQSFEDAHLEDAMQVAKQTVTTLLALRKRLQMKVKQPLGKWSVDLKTAKILSNYTQLIELIGQEANLKHYEILSSSFESQEGVVCSRDLLGESELNVFVCSTLTDELKAEGEARELIRTIQQERKKIGTRLDEIVDVIVPTIPSGFEAEIKQKVLARKLILGDEVSIQRFEA